MSFPVKAVIFDWSGTMFDFGCTAPVRALIDIFTAEGVGLSEAEARADMGMAKRDHLAAILAYPDVAARWFARHGHTPGEADVARVYEKLKPALLGAFMDAATLIPGAIETYDALIGLGVKVGSCTGATPEMIAAVREKVREQGYDPQVAICAGDTPSGRPSPLMAWAAMIALDAWPASACIKVDDAPVGIVEGREAGCWTVGIAASGNEVGLDRAAYLALPETERRARVAKATETLTDVGADYVIDDVSQLMPVVHSIAERIAARQG